MCGVLSGDCKQYAQIHGHSQAKWHKGYFSTTNVICPLKATLRPFKNIILVPCGPFYHVFSQ